MPKKNGKISLHSESSQREFEVSTMFNKYRNMVADSADELWLQPHPAVHSTNFWKNSIIGLKNTTVYGIRIYENIPEYTKIYQNLPNIPEYTDNYIHKFCIHLTLSHPFLPYPTLLFFPRSFGTLQCTVHLPVIQLHGHLLHLLQTRQTQRGGLQFGTQQLSDLTGVGVEDLHPASQKNASHN